MIFYLMKDIFNSLYKAINDKPKKPFYIFIKDKTFVNHTVMAVADFMA